MKHPKTELYFLITLVSLVSILAFFVFKPFIYTLILALVFSTVLYPLHEKVFSLTKGKNGLSTFLTALLVLFVVIVPLFFISLRIFGESTRLYSSLFVNGGATNISRFFTDIMLGLTKSFSSPLNISIDINTYIKEALNWLLYNLGPLFTNISMIFGQIFIFLISLYYLLKDGKTLKSQIIALSPLQDTHDEIIFNKLTIAINSVVRGSIFIAVIQGILVSLGFIVFGLPNATLWGIVAVIAALLPGVGTPMILIPAIIYLYFIGNVLFSIGLLVWSVFTVVFVENYLRSILSVREMSIHPFLILLSIFGGMIFFGPLGFILGPLTLSMLFVLFDLYSDISNKFSC